MGLIKFDDLFSYWIYFWFLLYYFIISVFSEKHEFVRFIQNRFNPKLAIIIALLENIVTFTIILIFNFQVWLIVYYILMILFVKVLPLYLLRKDKIHPLNDIIVLILLFLFYVWYLHNIKKTSLQGIYTKTYYSLIRGEHKTPLFHLVTQFFTIPQHINKFNKNQS